ncbi:hypothetical protein FHX37_3264 [Haloactinospora alba]|uniref:Uncharacterized protein n=1 Tax=Haloactinospora alba TaxID=405555 RepID=A0A543NN54_9ACTN|nr:DUF5957 family protein [Haloactinospora alba]TQN33259.1 hypothetical protein FHX37_3264 [Haloactinospora alba]
MTVLRTLGVAVLGMLGGFLLGLLVSEAIGIVGMVATGEPPTWLRAMRLAPSVLALAGGLAAPAVFLWRRET